MNSVETGTIAGLCVHLVGVTLLFAWCVATSQPGQVSADAEALSFEVVSDTPLFTDEAKSAAAESGRAWFEFGGVAYVVEDVRGWEAYL